MSLTPAQAEAAQATDSSVAVIASAGSGKTRVLIERYRHLMAIEDIPPYRILAFTFTEKAASEIKERILREKILKPAEEALLQIGTIHAFASRLLRANGPLLGIDPEYAITTETEAALFKNHHLKTYLLTRLRQKNQALAAIVGRFGFKRTFELASTLLNNPFLDAAFSVERQADTDERNFLSLVAEFAGKWRAEKIKRGLLDFDDLERLAVTLLKTNPEIRRSLQKRYRHVLVDEMQDTSPLQGEFIRQLHSPEHNRLFIVGDPKQSIYRFRGADISVFEAATAQIRAQNGKVISLDRTFRMPPALAEKMNRVFTPLFAESRIEYHPMVSPLPDTGGELRVASFSKEKMPVDRAREIEASFIAQNLRDRNLTPDELSRTAILFRSSAPMEIYRQALDAAGIPCRITHPTHLLGVPEIRDLVHLLGYLAGDKNRIAMAGILRSPAFSLSEQFIERFFHSDCPDFLGPFTPDLFMAHEDQENWQRLTAMIARWEGLKESLKPSDLFKLILSDLGLLPAESDDTRLNLEHWMHLLGEFESKKASDLKSIYGLLNSLEENDEEIDSLDPKNASGSVSLMTIHASKGLEFKRVFLPQIYARQRAFSADYLIDSKLGVSFKQEDPSVFGLKVALQEPPIFAQLKEQEEAEAREESKRLLYVAMTRAQEELTVFLKEPSKEKTDLKEAKDWNEWLWMLLEKERSQGVRLDDWELSKEGAPQISQQKSPVMEQEAPVEMPAERRSYAVSAIESFLRCEKEYELKYVFGIEAREGGNAGARSGHHLAGVPSSKWGVLIHEVLQFLDFNDPSNLQTVVEQALTNQQLSDPGEFIQSAVKETVRKIFADPEIKALLEETQTAFNETPFLADCGGFLIRGTLDRLMKKESGWIVVDYKTDRVKDLAGVDAKEKLYWGQLASYALATSQILGIDRVTTALLFTDGPYLRVQHWDRQKLTEAKEELSRMEECMNLKTLSSQNKGSPNPIGFEYPYNRSICHLCSYWEKNYCGVKQHSF